MTQGWTLREEHVQRPRAEQEAGGKRDGEVNSKPRS